MPTVTLMIRPQTNVRSVQGDRVFFMIPEEKLRPEGLKRKKRLQKYNQYKMELFDLANDKGFVIPDSGAHITFYIPIPKSIRKNKRPEMHLRPHRVKPDADNFHKAFQDALKKRDQTIWDYHVTKVWIEHPTGYIQIEY